MPKTKPPAKAQLVVAFDQEGRLDRFLTARFPDWSRTRLQKLIEDKHVLVDGQAVSAHFKLKSGHEVKISWPVPVVKEKKKTSPYPLPPILYEDDDLIVINKPAGLVVHPAVGHDDGHTLMEIMAPTLSEKAVWPDADRPGLVHRLDRDTSGVIVMAKTPSAQMNLSKQFAQRQVKKMYLGLVRGHVERSEGTLESNIARHPGMRQRFAVTDKGRWAMTKFKVKEYYGKDATLLELYPFTGRTHQIRVQVESFGHAILGDHVYGIHEKKFEFIKRHLLHAARLDLTHPSTGKAMSFAAPLPDDFQDAIKLIRLNS